jgi:hypothetical protein
MSHHKQPESLHDDDNPTLRQVLESVGVAALLVAAMFVIAAFLLLPVVPV